MFEHIGDALAQDLRDEKAAVEQDGVGNRIARAGEKRGQVTSDGGV